MGTSSMIKITITSNSRKEPTGFAEFVDHELVEFAGDSQFPIDQAAIVAGADLDGGQPIMS